MVCSGSRPDSNHASFHRSSTHYEYKSVCTKTNIKALQESCDQCLERTIPDQQQRQKAKNALPSIACLQSECQNFNPIPTGVLSGGCLSSNPSSTKTDGANQAPHQSTNSCLRPTLSNQTKQQAENKSVMSAAEALVGAVFPCGAAGRATVFSADGVNSTTTNAKSNRQVVTYDSTAKTQVTQEGNATSNSANHTATKQPSQEQTTTYDSSIIVSNDTDTEITDINLNPNREKITMILMSPSEEHMHQQHVLRGTGAAGANNNSKDSNPEQRHHTMCAPTSQSLSDESLLDNASILASSKSSEVDGDEHQTPSTTIQLSKNRLRNKNTSTGRNELVHKLLTKVSKEIMSDSSNSHATSSGSKKQSNQNENDPEVERKKSASKQRTRQHERQDKGNFNNKEIPASLPALKFDSKCVVPGSSMVTDTESSASDDEDRYTRHREAPFSDDDKQVGSTMKDPSFMDDDDDDDMTGPFPAPELLLNLRQGMVSHEQEKTEENKQDEGRNDEAVLPMFTATSQASNQVQGNESDATTSSVDVPSSKNMQSEKELLQQRSKKLPKRDRKQLFVVREQLLYTRTKLETTQYELSVLRGIKDMYQRELESKALECKLAQWRLEHNMPRASAIENGIQTLESNVCSRMPTSWTLLQKFVAALSIFGISILAMNWYYVPFPFLYKAYLHKLVVWTMLEAIKVKVILHWMMLEAIKSAEMIIEYLADSSKALRSVLAAVGDQLYEHVKEITDHLIVASKEWKAFYNLCTQQIQSIWSFDLHDWLISATLLVSRANEMNFSELKQLIMSK